MDLPLDLVFPDGARDRLLVSLSASDEAILKSFLADHHRMVESIPLEKGIPCSFHLKATPETGTVMDVELPTETELAAVLHRLRPFILHSEPASYNKVTALLGKLLPHAAPRGLLREQRRIWDGRAMQAHSPVRLRNRILNDEQLLMDWLNAHEYHRDPEKAAALRVLQDQVPEPMFRWIIVSLTLDKVRAVLNVAKVVSLLVGQVQELQFDGHQLVRTGG